MIISKTPFRISFFGGGTDYPAWYKENGGAVLSTTIDKYCYLNCRYYPPFFDQKHRIVWSKIELVNSADDIQLSPVRETLKLLDLDKSGIEVHHSADLPAQSGLGSSSAFTVGLLNSLYTLKGESPDKRKLALDAIHIEQELLKENVGSQDQVASAFGGFNKIIFGGEEHIKVLPIDVLPENLSKLQDNLMLFFTGFSRIASDVAGEQIKNTPNNVGILKEMSGLVDEAIDSLSIGGDVDDFGRLLGETWKLKRGLSSKITNSDIDNIYNVAMDAGALGGKLLGAGGGGFILFYVQPEFQEKIKSALKNLTYVPFKFDTLGSQIIYKQDESTLEPLD